MRREDNGAKSLVDVIKKQRAEENQARLLAAAERAAERTCRIQRVTAALSRALTMEQVAEAIIAEGFSILGAEAGTIVLLSEDATRFHILRAFGYPAEMMAAWQDFPLDPPLHVSDAVRTREPVLLESVAARDARYPMLAGVQAISGAGASVALPLLAGDRALGAIALAFPTERRFDTEDVAFMSTLAGVCAQALERARLYTLEQQGQRWFRALTENSSDLIVVFDAEGRYLYLSPSLETMLGYRYEDVRGHNGFAVLHPDDLGQMRELRARMVAGSADGPVTLEVRLRHADGSWRILECIAVNRLADPAINGIIVNARDITARTAAETALRQREMLFRALTENATDLVSIVDGAGIFQYVSPSFHSILGYDPAQLLGTLYTDYFHPEDVAAVRKRWSRRLAGRGDVTRSESRVRHADGSWLWLENLVRVALDDPIINGVISNARDITGRKRAEEMLRHQALHDVLTGLPNRTLLNDRLEQALLQARREEEPLALLLLDMDRFKEVNDTFGHHHGDTLLQQVAERLRGALRSTDTVARLGGDEFAVLLPGDDVTGAIFAAGKIAAALDAPITVDDQPLRCKTSIGVASYPAHGDDAQTLLRHADVAMYVAKRGGRTCAVYTPEQDDYNRDRLRMTTELREAIDGGGLVLHYQPVVEMAPCTVAYVEALARWDHPRRGLLPPDVFIPLAEQMGLIGALTQEVLAVALRQCRAWRAAGMDLGVAINLSMANLLDARLVETVLALLDTCDVPPSYLRVELTESCIMSDQAHTLEVLMRLARAGVSVSIDDFGTGYSSLAYLTRLPVDTLKIDKSFVQEMAAGAADAVIVRSTITMAHSLGLRVVAEGVEDGPTWEALARLGCDAAQGYYLSHPLPAAELEEWLRRRSAA